MLFSGKPAQEDTDLCYGWDYFSHHSDCDRNNLGIVIANSISVAFAAHCRRDIL